MSRRWTDRILGVALGVVIGLGVLVYFVFVHSEGTIDAPKVHESATRGRTTPPPEATGEGEALPGGEEGAAKQGEEAPTTGGAKQPKKPVPVVKVIGGAPTNAGPKQLTFHKGEKVRFEIETNEPFTFEIRGLGIEETIQESSVVSFKATKVGQFPVIATATVIGVADLIVKPPR